ncbi:hypothetical protein CVV72_05370 [Amycolatopsis sp. TNS106]|nr:hypothetical protein CVV72_05370 [Amycolatopsis sp. TNS106]
MSVVINGLLLIGIHAGPGWRAVPFLTDETDQVLGVVTMSLVVGMVSSLVCVGYGAEWFTSVAGLAATVTGLVAVIRIWQVFPFDFGGASFDWPLTVRVLLVIAIAGSAIGALVQLVTLLRAGIRSLGEG